MNLNWTTQLAEWMGGWLYPVRGAKAVQLYFVDIFLITPRPTTATLPPAEPIRQDVEQIRLHQGPEGGPLLVLRGRDKRSYELIDPLDNDDDITLHTTTPQHPAFPLDHRRKAFKIPTFLTRAYPTMKKNNPHTPILLREAAGTIPRVYARYEFGKEKSQSLEGLSDKQIEDTVATLVKSDV
ncbi:hypothetical protein O1611_g10529 [Lasiodiplodia mahajangana]|uniref:Uncharacterized protein n=1 Tax=Lasiodiplodia mahajangana TaxID=1108764 RepID=A0ACC2IXL3_9PEZI|nr:hypothetical protein O1611_g10529 [Lasiodiplodia mahajangana]